MGLPDESHQDAPGSPTEQRLVEGPVSPRTLERQDVGSSGAVGAIRRGARFSLLLAATGLAAFVCVMAGAALASLGGSGGGGGGVADTAGAATGPPPPAGFAWRSLGQGTLCALDTADPKAMRGASVRRVSASSQRDCQQQCQAERGCKGVEYSQGSCGLWLQPVTGSEGMPGSECFVLLRAGRFRRHHRAACVARGEGHGHDHAPARTLKNVGEDLCGVLCQAILGQNCSAAEHHSSGRCKIWSGRARHAAKGAKDTSCALFVPSAVRGDSGGGGAAAGSAESTEGSSGGPSFAWGSLDKVFPWMAPPTTTQTSVTATTVTETQTETDTTTTLTSTTTRPYCHTADLGEECHSQVVWVKSEGLVLHPEWYPDLSATSTFEDIQQNLNSSNPDSGCPTPCTDPSLFCFVVLTDGADDQGDSPAEGSFGATLVEKQRSMGGGVFACDSHAVYSGQKEEYMESGLPLLNVIKRGDAAAAGEATVNTKLFMDVWEQIRKDGVYRKHDWTVKADPDTVFFPHRLRQRLWDLKLPTDSPMFVKNAAVKSGFAGALEILSTKAVEALVKNQGACYDRLGDSGGEDIFVHDCLSHSHGVTSVSDRDLLEDKATPKDGGSDWLDIAPCADSHAAAFHPYRAVDAWMGCQAVALGLEKLDSFPVCQAGSASACRVVAEAAPAPADGLLPSLAA